MRRLIVPMFLVAACSSYNQVLDTSLKSVIAVSDGWNKWDTAHELRLVADAPDKIAATKAVHDYRVASEPVHKAVLGAYAALLVASTKLDADSIRAVADGVARLVDELKKIGAIP